VFFFFFGAGKILVFLFAFGTNPHGV